jgi:hypothetical protein
MAGQQSKLTDKLENLALNMFLVMNEPKEQEFFLKNIQNSADSGIWSAPSRNFLQLTDIFGWSTIKTNEKTRKITSKLESFFVLDPWSSVPVAYSSIRPNSQIFSIGHDYALWMRWIRIFVVMIKKPENLDFETWTNGPRP